MDKESYVIGSPKPPAWCRDLIMPYIRNDGGTGYEVTLDRVVFELRSGDILIWNGRRVTIKRH